MKLASALALIVVFGILAGCAGDPVVESPTAGQNTGIGNNPAAKAGSAEAGK